MAGDHRLVGTSGRLARSGRGNPVLLVDRYQGKSRAVVARLALECVRAEQAWLLLVPARTSSLLPMARGFADALATVSNLSKVERTILSRNRRYRWNVSECPDKVGV